MPRPCRACNRMIDFVKGPAGRPVPVDKVRTVYIAERPPGGGPPELKTLKAIDDAAREGHAIYVSHFETCTDPNRFSGRARRGDD